MFVWLQQGWGCSELKPPALWPKWESQSEAIFTPPPSAEKLDAGLSRLERRSSAKNKKKKKKKKLTQASSSLERKFEGGFLYLSSWAWLGLCVCVWTYDILFDQWALLTANCRWIWRKINNGQIQGAWLHTVHRTTTTSHFYHLSTPAHKHVELCVAQSKGQKGQDFQMFPIILWHWLDLPGPSVLFLFSECKRKVKSWLTMELHCCLYWTGFIKTWVSIGHKKTSTQNGKPPFLWLLKENPWCLQGMTPLTVFLS